MRRAVATGPIALAFALALAPTTPVAFAQTPLAIERDPPIATRPVAPAPVLVPSPTPGAPPMVAAPPLSAAPVVVPPGPAPIAVPEAPKPSLAPIPAAPPLATSTPAPAAPPPVGEPPATTPPSEAAPPVPPAPAPAPSEPAPTTAAPATPPAPPPVAAPAPDPLSAPEEVTVAPRAVLFVTGTTTWDDAEEEMGKAFAALAQTLRKSNAKSAGGPLVQYIETEGDDVGYKAMLPFEGPAPTRLPKTVKVGRSPGGRALEFRHAGALDDLEVVYARIDDVLQQRGLETTSIVEQYDEDALASPEDRVVMRILVFLK